MEITPKACHSLWAKKQDMAAMLNACEANASTQRSTEHLTAVAKAYRVSSSVCPLTSIPRIATDK